MILNILLFVSAVLSGGLIKLFVEKLNPWWLLLIVPAFFILYSLLYLLVIFVASLILNKKEPTLKSAAASRFWMGYTLHWLLGLIGIRIHLTGRELLPDEPCVLVSNHLSDFDPMTVLAVLRDRKLIYISKESNFRIPMAGPFIRHSGFLAIDRENAMRAMRTLKKAAEMMKTERVDVGIYPEGTRSKTGELLEFKAGAFLLAKKADAPIVIMTTRGTDRIKQRIPFRFARVDLDIFEVMDRETVRSLSLDEITVHVRKAVEERLTQ